MQLKQTIWGNAMVILMSDVIMNPTRGFRARNRDDGKILQISNRTHKMQFHCTPLLIFKYAENQADDVIISIMIS